MWMRDLSTGQGSLPVPQRSRMLGLRLNSVLEGAGDVIGRVFQIGRLAAARGLVVGPNNGATVPVNQE